MAYSYTAFTGNGSTTQYAVSFPYIRREHVAVTVAGIPSTFTWVNNSLIQMDAAPANGAAVRVYRTTPISAPLVDFADGATLVAADLDTNSRQSIYIQQELDDAQTDNLPNVIPNGNKGDITTSVGGTVWAINNGAVTEAKINNGAVTSAKILDGTIVNADVNPSAGITAGKLSFTQAGTGATARTIDSKLKDTVSVKDFGAVGDGIADDTAAIQAAIAAATILKKAVFISAGRYVVNSTITAPEFFSFIGEESHQKGGDNTPTTESRGVIIDWQGSNSDSVFLIDHYSCKDALIKNILVSVPTGYAGNIFHAKGSRFFSQGWTNKHRYENLSVYRAGTIGPQVTTACAFYWDCTNATAADGQAFFGCIANNLTAFNVADTIKVQVVNNSLGTPGLDNWFNSNFINNVEGYQVYRGINLIGGSTAGNAIYRNTFSNVVIQPGLGTGGTYAAEVITGSGAATVADNLFINVLVWDHPTDVFASAWQKVNTRLGCKESGLNMPGNALVQGKGIFGGGNFVAADIAGSVQVFGTGAYNSQAGQLTLFDATNVNRNVRIGYDPSLEMGYVQAAKQGVANEPLLLCPNGGNLIVGNTADIAGIKGQFNGVVAPSQDNTFSLGTAAYRWSVIYAGTGTINTSDGRDKQDIAALDDAEKRVATALKSLIRKYRFKDAVVQKGNDARIHVGIIVQDVVAAFEAENLNPMQYGIVCHDRWEATLGKNDNEIRPAGDRYGIRYEELLAFIISAL